MEVLEYLSLNKNHRGLYFSKEYIEIEESADIKGCLFFKCTFKSEENFIQAKSEGVCVDCSVGSNTSDVRYVQSKLKLSLYLDYSDEFGILDGGTLGNLMSRKYTIFTGGRESLMTYGLTADPYRTEWEETESISESEALEPYSDKYTSKEGEIFRVEDLRLASFSHTEREFGEMSVLEFNSYERLYGRDEGIYYSGILYVPAEEINSEKAYLFCDDVYLGEISCGPWDIKYALEKAFPEKENLINMFDDEHEDFQERFEDYQEFNSFQWSLKGHLTDEEIDRLLCYILGAGDRKLVVKQKYKLFDSVIKILDSVATPKDVQGVTMYEFLNKNSLFLDDSVLIVDGIPKIRLVET